MQRWSLSNWVSPISHQQFLEMLGRYRETCEDAFGTECSVEIEARSQDLVHSTFVDPAIDGYLDRLNRPVAIRYGSGSDGLTSFAWRAARHVGCVIRPRSAQSSMRHAFAHAEFKGARPKQASFYVQCADGDVRAAMIGAFPGMRRGTGRPGNSVDAKLLPESVIRSGASIPGYRTVPGP